MPKVIHTSLREARSLDKEDSVSSLWIWNSGNHADTIVTSDDDDAKWFNDALSKSPSDRSRQPPLSKTPSSHSSGASRKLNLSSDDQKALALSQSPSPAPSKLGVSDKVKAVKPNLLVAPPAATMMDRDVSKHSYTSDDYGSVGEFSLQEEEEETAGKQGSWWNVTKPPPPPPSHDGEETEREGDSFSNSFTNSPAPSLSKYVKRIGNGSATSSLALQASDPDMQPRVVEVNEDDEMDSYVSDEDIKDTEHLREVPEHDQDTKETEHQRLESSEEVPISEAAMRQKKIDTELNRMIEEMMESDEFYEEEEMEPESFLAIMRAAKEICYTRKYYAVSKDKIIYFPSVIKTIVQNDLFEKAEEYYYEEGDEFPTDYIMALRSIALDRMVAEEEKADSAHYSLDDDTMHRMSIRVQRTEADFDELKAFIAAADEEDELEEQEEEAHQESEKKAEDLPAGAQSAVLKAVTKEDKKLGAAKAQANEMWWEVAPDTEQKFSMRTSRTVEAPPPPPPVSEPEPIAAKAEEQLEEEPPEHKPKQRRSTWWNLDSESKQMVSSSLRKLDILDSEDDVGPVSSESDQSDSDSSSEASDTDSKDEPAEAPLETKDAVGAPQPVTSEKESQVNDMMKWFSKDKSQSDGPNKATNRISLLLPKKSPEALLKKIPEPILAEGDPAREGTQVHERSQHYMDDEFSDAESEEQQTEHERQPISAGVDGVSKESTSENIRSTEGAFQVEQMIPKTRRSKQKDASASNQEDQEKKLPKVTKPNEAAMKVVPESIQDIETDEHDFETAEAEDETIDDDDDDNDSLSTESFEVEDIVFESKHGRGNKFHDNDSAVSSLHASAYGDENDVAPGDAMASLASMMMRSTEFVEADTKEVACGNLSAADNSTLSEGIIQVSENKDGRSGTWNIGGTYENATKEDMTELLKKIQKDIILLIQKGENSTAASKSSSNGDFSLVLSRGVEKTVSGITLNSLKVPDDGDVQVKSKGSKKKRESKESGWKKVAAKSPERLERSERTAVRSNKTPLTNLSNVTEESIAEGADEINWIFSTKEGRSPASPSRSKRKIRKGRRKSTGSHDEADDFYDFQLPFTKESSDGSSRRGRSVPRSGSASTMEQSKSEASGSSKASKKSLTKKKRSKSNASEKKPSSSKPRRSVSVEIGTVSRTKKRSSSKPRRSASVESGAVPRRAPSSKRGSKKNLKDSTGVESTNAGQSPASLRKSFSNAGRSASVPTLKETPKPKPQKKLSSRLSTLSPFGRRSTGDIETKRTAAMRMKKESSLRELERRLERVGIQQSPPSAEEKKKNPLDLKSKAKEVDGLRDKLRLSLARVIKSP